MERKNTIIKDARTEQEYIWLRRGDPRAEGLSTKRQLMRRGLYPTGEICGVTMLAGGAFVPLYRDTEVESYEVDAPKPHQTPAVWPSKPKLQFVRADGSVRASGEPPRSAPKHPAKRSAVSDPAAVPPDGADAAAEDAAPADPAASDCPDRPQNTPKKRRRRHGLKKSGDTASSGTPKPLPHYAIRDGETYRARVAEFGMLDPAKTLFIDLEMTGVCSQDEALSVSIADGTGRCLFDSLVRPVRVKNWNFTVHIHHITGEMVADAPTLEELAPQLRPILEEAEAIIGYGVGGDWHILRAVCPEEQQMLLDKRIWCCHELYCAYLRFGLPEGSEIPQHTNLKEAMTYFNLMWDGCPHSSMADALACAAVWNRIVGSIREDGRPVYCPQDAHGLSPGTDDPQEMSAPQNHPT